jgi:hypothetical protein
MPSRTRMWTWISACVGPIRPAGNAGPIKTFEF